MHSTVLISKGEAKLSFDKQRRGEVLTRNERQRHSMALISKGIEKHSDARA